MTDQPIIGVVGLGAMGLGIAQIYAAAGFKVIATDSFAPARDTALDRLAQGLSNRVKDGKLSADDLRALLARITIVDSLPPMRPAGLVIEAVVENITVKRDLFAALEAILPATAVLASNTSALCIGHIAKDLRHPERVLGLHFFNPAPVMKLVELVAHPTTAPEALALARQLTEAAGKVVIACPDRPGFIVNRCARPYYGEALAMLEEGRTAAEIDAAMQAAGYRLGPFALIDLIGADINLAATENLSNAMANHPRYHVFDRLKQQVASGHLGRKTGQGFHFPNPSAAPPPDAAEIVARIEATLVNEAGWLLSEGGTTPDGIDTALKLGLNFPRGPFEIEAARGAVLRSTLNSLETAAPPQLKGRYLPCPRIQQT